MRSSRPAGEAERSAAQVPTTACRYRCRGAFTFPDQRNYNVNFAIDEVVTQMDNSYSNQFYQPFTGPRCTQPRPERH